MKNHPLLTLTIFTGFFLTACSSNTKTTSDNIATVAATHNAVSADSLAQETLNEVNNHRASKGLVRLKFHPGLNQLALKHSQAMFKKDEMSHFGFSKRAKISQKKHQMGAMSENLHRSWNVVPTGGSITNQWVNSPKHRENMEGDYSHAGLGIIRVNNNIFTTLLLGQSVQTQTFGTGRTPLLGF